MNVVHHLNLLDKGRRHHRRAMLKDSSLAALVNGAGWVIANGSLKVALPLVDGTVAVYVADPRTEWRFSYDAQASKREMRVDDVVLTPADRVKAHIDCALNVLADIERKAREVNHNTIAAK